ncbi:MAG: hypothetical protein GXP29_12780 [Planctomycetes bacterium]|nr:hypothetical protein [Planctomycetota bacterium]
MSSMTRRWTNDRVCNEENIHAFVFFCPKENGCETICAPQDEKINQDHRQAEERSFEKD